MEPYYISEKAHRKNGYRRSAAKCYYIPYSPCPCQSVYITLLYIYIYIFDVIIYLVAIPGGSVVKNSPVNSEDKGSVPESGRSLGEGDGNPFQYSCLENPMDRGGW